MKPELDVLMHKSKTQITLGVALPKGQFESVHTEGSDLNAGDLGAWEDKEFQNFGAGEMVQK